MQQIVQWLEGFGLGQYGDAFVQADIDLAVLPDLTEADLAQLGVTLGHRKKLLRAIAALSDGQVSRPEPPSPAPEPTATGEAERRQVTVMVCDLVGSTELASRLDPEDLREVIGRYHARVAETVRRFDGFVAKYMGDGALVYFGYPQAHEDDAEQAVRAGLALVEAVSKLDHHGGTALQVRIGIATGLVVVGDLLGEGEAQERGIVGETPNLAARLQGLAEPSAVVIASSTRSLTRGLFEYRDLGTVALKGFAENVPAWQVLGVGFAEGRFEALRAATTPLVGRAEEIELLLRRWEQAKRGDGQVVLIAGEPGIGKSRVAQTIVERISAEPHTRLRYFCSPHHQDSALYPSIAQLERAAGFRRDDTPEQRLEKLEAVLAQGTNDFSEAVPLMADLLLIPIGDRYPPLNLTPQKRKERTLHAQLVQVEGLSARQPVLMIWEDIHWSDPTTREGLDLIVDRIATLRVLVIITFRPEFMPPWVGRPHVTMLTLNRLPASQRAEMIVHVTGGKVLPKEIEQQIVDRTDGVPLFVEELTKNVIESGMVTDTGDQYAVVGPIAPLAIPTSLHASLLARLDRLAPTREIAQIGAALGRSFSHELIGAVAPMPQRQLDDALDQLVRAELIFRRGTPPNAEYTFKHALVQDAAYSTLLRSRRRHLHSRIAATLEDRFPEVVTAQPALLAHHCGEAGLTEEAVIYWLKAGQQALARSAMTEAVAQLRKGLDVLVALPDSPRRRQQELDLQIALRTALGATRGYGAAEVGEANVRARALAEQIDRPEYLVPLIYVQWQFHFVRAEHRLALSLAERIEKIGEVRNEVATQLLGCRTQGATRCFLGEFVAARALLERGIGLSDPAHRAIGAGLSDDPYAAMLGYLALILAYLGYIDQARSRLDEALSDARRLRHASTLATVLLRANWMESITCAPELQQHADELLALSTEHGLPLFVAWAMAFRGRSLTALGQAQEGLTLLRQGLAGLRATGAVHTTPLLLMWLAEAYATLGQPVEGLNCLAEAARIIESTEERVHEVELHRLRGGSLNITGDRSAAERNCRQAIAVAERQCAKLLQLRASTSLARLWRAQGKIADAHDLLAPIYGWFTEGFDTPDLIEAKALLDELEAALGRSPATATPISART